MKQTKSTNLAERGTSIIRSSYGQFKSLPIPAPAGSRAVTETGRSMQRPVGSASAGANSGQDFIKTTRNIGLGNRRDGTYVTRSGNLNKVNMNTKGPLSRTRRAVKGNVGLVYHTIKRVTTTGVNMAASNGDVADGLSKIRTAKNVASPATNLAKGSLKSVSLMGQSAVALANAKRLSMTTSRKAAEKLDFLDSLSKGDRAGAMERVLKKTDEKIKKTEDLIKTLKARGQSSGKAMDVAWSTLKRLQDQRGDLIVKWEGFANKYQGGAISASALKQKAQDIRSLKEAKHMLRRTGNKSFGRTDTSTLRLSSTAKTNVSNLKTRMAQKVTNKKMSFGNRLLKRAGSNEKSLTYKIGNAVTNSAERTNVLRTARQAAKFEKTSAGEGLTRKGMNALMKENRNFIKLHKKDGDIAKITKLDKKLTKKFQKANTKAEKAANRKAASKKNMRKSVRSSATGSIKMVVSLCTSQMSGEAMQGMQQIQKASRPIIKSGKFAMKQASRAAKGTTNFAVKKATGKTLTQWTKKAKKKVMRGVTYAPRKAGQALAKVAAVPVKYAARAAGKTAAGQAVKVGASTVKGAVGNVAHAAKNATKGVTNKLKDAVKKAVKFVGQMVLKALMFVIQGVMTFILSNAILICTVAIIAAPILMIFMAFNTGGPHFSNDRTQPASAASATEDGFYMGPVPNILSGLTAELNKSVEKLYTDNYKDKKYSQYSNEPIQSYYVQYYQDSAGTLPYSGKTVKENYKELFAELYIWGMREGGTIDDKTDDEIKAHLTEMYNKTHKVIKQEYQDGGSYIPYCTTLTIPAKIKSYYSEKQESQTDYANPTVNPMLDENGNQMTYIPVFYTYDPSTNTIKETTGAPIPLTYTTYPTKMVTVTEAAQKTEDSDKKYLCAKIGVYVDHSEATFTEGMTEKEKELFQMYASDKYDLGIYASSDVSEVGYKDYNGAIEAIFIQSEPAIALGGDSYGGTSLRTGSLDMSSARKAVADASTPVGKAKAIGSVLKYFVTTYSSGGYAPYTGEKQTESVMNYAIKQEAPVFPMAPLPPEANGDGTKSTLEKGCDGPGFIWRLYTENMTKEVREAYGEYATYDEILARANNGTYKFISAGEAVPGDLCVKVSSSGTRASVVYVVDKDLIAVTPGPNEKDWTGMKLTGAPGTTDGNATYGWYYSGGGSSLSRVLIENAGNGYTWKYIRVFK